MTVTIKYKYRSDFADSTISSVTKYWATEHGDITTAETKEYGFFAGGDYFGGTQYALPSSHNIYTGMIIEGNLNYSFTPQHTLSGRIDSLVLGRELVENTTGLGRKLKDPFLEFSGLDITGKFDPLKTQAENHQGETHKAAYGFMRGNADPFLDILKAKGIDVDTPLKDMAIASQFDNNNEMVSDAPMPVIDVIGSYDEAEVLMAA
ncbi:heme acquisition protein HasA [Yersinia hibernica]|uniref:Heme acquisition hemophore HasA n=1 Tax=Yersinia hibernica TaxID=2339259 RepID=A0ABX5QVG5_9GAMM|nr:heme acquisition protein HasA [Yersinia hibernica]QAX77219.1 heme acquisition hemophore HasA [Yersinia hibernica]